MSELDQTARYALKLAAVETLAWLVPALDPDLAFTRWLDTETIAFPGEPRRRCDTVAELVSRSGASPAWALVLEVEARPTATIGARLLEYLARLLRKLRHGPRKRDRYLLAAVLLFLRGTRPPLSLTMQLPGTEIRLDWQVRVGSLAAESAAATLARIERGELGRSVLSWVPLMAGAGEPAVVQEWARLAGAEPDEQRRSDYAGLAKVFAEWAGCLPAWKSVLEDWNVWKSQVIKEWKDAARQEGLQEGRQVGLQEGRQEGRQLGLQEGELRTKRTDVLKVLRARFHAEVPADLVQALEQTTDLERLSTWFDAALTTPSLDAFRTVVAQASNGS